MPARRPLAGVRVLEMAGIGPGPFCAMMLADHGAEVIRVDRPGGVRAGPATDERLDPLLRSRRSVAVDLKRPGGAEVVKRLAQRCDVFLEGYRPGVMERLGLGPADLFAGNPRLVYGRMTGWGQDGPLASAAGHDINYIGLSGALHAIGRAGEKPTPPLNLVGDFGGGGLLLAFGIVAAVLAARETGQGQVVDCAMSEGSALLMAMIYGRRAMDDWSSERGTNLLDTGAHFYDTYECADGEHVALGAIEPQFYAEFLERAGIADDAELKSQDPEVWPRLKLRLQEVFRTRSRAEWDALMANGDGCCTPVLSMSEAPSHPHNIARSAFVEVGGVVQPAPAPRYSGTATPSPAPPRAIGADTDTILCEAGFAPEEVEELRGAGAVA